MRADGPNRTFDPPRPSVVGEAPHRGAAERQALANEVGRTGTGGRRGRLRPARRPGRRPVLRDRVPNPSGRRAGPGRRPAGIPSRLALAAEAARPGALRGLAPPTPRERLLRGVPPVPAVAGERAGTPARRTGGVRPDRRHRPARWP